MKAKWMLLAVICSFAACTARSAPEDIATDQHAEVSDAAAMRTDTTLRPEVVDQRSESEIRWEDAVSPDLDWGRPWEPWAGFGAPCETNSDCEGCFFCVPTDLGKICTCGPCACCEYCSDLPAPIGTYTSCFPAGDVLCACVPDHGRVACRYCEVDADCSGGSGPGLCLDLPDGKKGCAEGCWAGDRCLPGFECVTHTSAAGLEAKVCLSPLSGTPAPPGEPCVQTWCEDLPNGTPCEDGTGRPHQACHWGVCIQTCTPYCGQKQCGDDTCGGSCGECGEHSECVQGGGSAICECLYATCGDVCCASDLHVCDPLGECCVPDCAGKECGEDGCGGLCGICEPCTYCTAEFGACLPGPLPECVQPGETSCSGFNATQVCIAMDQSSPECGGFWGDIQSCPTQHVCEGGECVCSCPVGFGCEAGACVCLGIECGEECCPDIDGMACFEGECCLPSCTCMGCGDDGCGGSCGDCDDENECTVDTCEGANCVHTVLDEPGCCEETEDCEDGVPCTTHKCFEHQCLFHRPWDCCVDDDDCVPGSPCIDAWCDPVEHTCDWVQKSVIQQVAEGLECCQSHDDCGPGGLWEEDADGDGIPGPDDPATMDYCQDTQCVHLQFPEGCQCNAETGSAPCADIGPQCNFKVCHDDCVCLGYFEPPGAPGCCANSWDNCEDGDLWTVSSCDVATQKCVQPMAGSCCGGGCWDGDVCTVDDCFYPFGCIWTPIPGCCNNDEDCDDCDPCTEDHCYSHYCHYDQVENYTYTF